MAASREDISGWFDRGVAKGATHMIVVCDTYDYEDYPAFVGPNEDVREEEKKFHGNMQQVMEVYNLSKDKNEQLNRHRCWEY